MSSPGLPTLQLDLRSRRVEERCAILLTLFAWAAPMLVVSNIGFWWSAGIGLMTSSGVLGGCYLAGWLGGAAALRSVTWRSDGSWVLCDARRRNFDAVLHAASRMSPHAIWLRWDLMPGTPPAAGTRRTRTLLLCPGDLPPDDFRRLLVRLRVDRSECAPIAAQALPTASS